MWLFPHQQLHTDGHLELHQVNQHPLGLSCVSQQGCPSGSCEAVFAFPVTGGGAARWGRTLPLDAHVRVWHGSPAMVLPELDAVASVPLVWPVSGLPSERAGSA